MFARVSVKLKDELKADKRPPRSKDDYAIAVDGSDLPDGVRVEQWV